MSSNPRVIGTTACSNPLPRDSLTEKRGHRQVLLLLASSIVQEDHQLMKIFRIIEQDEPSHWAPYDGWLEAHGRRQARWWERAIDGFIHSELLFLKLPVMFVNARIRRRTAWPDEQDGDRAKPPIGADQATLSARGRASA